MVFLDLFFLDQDILPTLLSSKWPGMDRSSSNRNSMVPSMVMSLIALGMASYNLVVGQSIKSEHRWQSLVPTLATAAQLPQDQVNAFLMRAGEPRDALISLGMHSPWSAYRNQGQQYFTFTGMSRDACRGLMRLWKKQGQAFPMIVNLNQHILAHADEDQCRGKDKDKDPQRHLTLSADLPKSPSSD